MKKLLLLGACVVAVVMLTGCHAAYHVGGGFPRTMPGVLIANQTSGGYISPKVESMKDMEILGPVSSTVSADNALTLISAGDVSIAKAKELAMRKYPNADDIVNVEIDMQHTGILSLFNTVTMHYSGIAIKYKK